MKRMHKDCSLAEEEKLQPNVSVYKIIFNLCEDEYLENYTSGDFWFEM